jgi:predicted esterase
MDAWRCAVVTALLALPAGAAAQVERFELGQRLRGLDRALAARPEAAARRRAVPALLRANTALFLGRDGEAARELDQACRDLLSDRRPAPEAVWAASLLVRPASRLLVDDAAELPVTLAAFYPAAAPAPADARFRLTLSPAAGRPVRREAPITVVPLEVRLPLEGVGTGDHTLRAEIVAGGKVWAERFLTVSRVARLRPRLEALGQAVGELSRTSASTDAATAGQVLGLLHLLAEGRTPETNYPADRLLAEAEAVVRSVAAGKRYYGPGRPGQFWLNLTTAAGPVPARVLVPAAATSGKDLPLVIALHGMGGSENLFFEGYGSGEVVRLCQQRGWLLVAPRTTGLHFAAPVQAVLDEVARLYPVDGRHVFIVGHSMGAAQAVAAAVQAPGRFAAVAAVSGGNRVARSGGLEKLPFFVAAGDRDFALKWSGALARDLRGAGVRTVRFKEYPDAEHILVVPLALADVFAFFDAAARP